MTIKNAHRIVCEYFIFTVFFLDKNTNKGYNMKLKFNFILRKGCAYMSTKIDIISGFLGSGKTTLIKKLLSEKNNEKIVIIENEFGEIGIDGGILKETGLHIKEINSGCICCSLVGDFSDALKEMLKKFSPDRIIIEPSGVGKLSDVLATCNKFAKGDITVNMCITVVDATKYKMYSRNFAEFFSNQIINAKTIIMSRTQNTDSITVSGIVKQIHEQNPNANIITTNWDDLSPNKIIFVAECAEKSDNILTAEEMHICNCGHHNNGEDCNCGHHHNHHADEIFDVWGAETPEIFSNDGLNSILEKLSDEKMGTVLRAKGIIPINKKDWIQFDFVPEEIKLNKIDPDYIGRICVIGERLNKNELAKLFGI